MKKLIQKDFKSERGTAAMEFALLLPVFLMLVLGIVYFGIGFNTKINLTAGVREGARKVALGGSGAEGKAKVRESTPDLGLTDPDITVTTCENNAQNAVVRAQKDVEYNLLFVHGTWTINATGVMRCEVWRSISS